MKKRLLQLSIFLFLASTAHAYYQTEQGRWLNRDPIGEQGGANVYHFTYNSPVLLIDVLGAISGGYYGPGDPIYDYNHPRSSKNDNRNVGWAMARSDLWIWIKGSPDSDYSSENLRSKNAANSTIGQNLENYTVKKFKEKKCGEWGSVTNFKGKFNIIALVSDGKNGTSQFIGSATGSASSNSSIKCKVTVTYTLTNTTSITSLLYGLWPDKWNQPSGSAMGNWTQTYTWNKEYDCKE